MEDKLKMEVGREGKTRNVTISQSGPEFTPWDLAKTFDPERNINLMGQSTEMSPPVSMLFRTFLNPLKFLMEIFIIILYYIAIPNFPTTLLPVSQPTVGAMTFDL